MGAVHEGQRHITVVGGRLTSIRLLYSCAVFSSTTSMRSSASIRVGSPRRPRGTGVRECFDDLVGPGDSVAFLRFNQGMLASLLPGLRDLRAPLAAGYVWLVVAWLTVGRHLSASGEGTGLLKDVYRLSQSAGRPAVGVAVTFAAYLVGVLSVAVSQKLVEILSGISYKFGRGGLSQFPIELGPVLPLRGARAEELGNSYSWRLLPFGWSVTTWRTSGMWPSRASTNMLRGAIEEAGAPVASDNNYDESLTDVLRELITDLTLVPSRLIGRDPELYGTYDRKRSEAEFRAAVSLPLFIACFAIALETSWFWLLALPVPLILIRQALQLQQGATDVLAEAVRSGRVDSPVLQRLQKVASERDKSSLPAQTASEDAAPAPPAPTHLPSTPALLQDRDNH